MLEWETGNQSFSASCYGFLTLSKLTSVDVAQARGSVVTATRRQGPQLSDYNRRKISCLPTNEECSSRGEMESKELPGHSAMTIGLTPNPDYTGEYFPYCGTSLIMQLKANNTWTASHFESLNTPACCTRMQWAVGDTYIFLSLWLFPGMLF